MPEESSAACSSASEEEKPCSSSQSAAADGSEVMEEAKKLIGTGNRHLVMGDLNSALGAFQDACSLLAERFGDTADECGEAFFLCGKTLLELARMENGVLGNALDGVPEEEEEQPADSNIESADNLDADDDDDNDDDDDDDEGEAADGENKEEEEEEVGNLQLAWEMLEVAKVIYRRKEGREDQLMAAQAYLKLGEVGAESGNYPQALEDFQECLALQLKLLPDHSRLLAETHYQVATTLCLMEQYSDAQRHYGSAVSVIQARLALLQEQVSAAPAEASRERSELEELQLLLPDIREKVEDAKESQRTASAASHAIQHTLGGPSSSSSAFLCENGGPSSSKAAFPASSQISVKPESSLEGASSSSPRAVSDISHLVRKKRKPEEQSPVTDTKHAKQESTSVNGRRTDSSAPRGREGRSQEPAPPSPSVPSSS